ncbi:SH3 domain-containing protein, partial [Natribacillus halophilus]
MECKSIVSTFLMSFLIVGLTESQLSAEVGTAEELEEVDKTHGIVRSPLLNVRSGPDEEYEVIGELDDYTRVELEGETSDGWYKINAEEFSDEAYVSASAIVPVDEPEYEEGYVEGDLVNVREGPSEDETDVAQLEQGEQVEVVGEIDDWYKIRVDDVEGSTYVNGSYITSEEPDALDETEESTSEEIQVAETDERTFEETQDLSEPEYSHGIVQSSYLNVRSGPGTDHETIGGLEDYTRVELEGETSDGWYQISGEGFSGDAYVSGDFIVPVDLPEYEEGYVDSDLLNVREGPGVDEARVHQLERNEQLEVVGEIDGWYKLQLDDIDGPTYVSGNHITPEETLELTEPEYSHGIVQSSYLNVRSGPGTDHETIGGL